MMMHNTRESAIRRDEFHRILQEWLDDTFEEHVGEAEHHAGSAWLWVRHGGEHYYLDAAATRSGIREYLRMVSASTGEIPWQTVKSQTGQRDVVNVGTRVTPIEGLELYRHVPRR
jgi:hypothetical protein